MIKTDMNDSRLDSWWRIEVFREGEKQDNTVKNDTNKEL